MASVSNLFTFPCVLACLLLASFAACNGGDCSSSITTTGARFL